MAPTLDEQIAEVRREVDLRARLYPSWVSARKMSQQKADLQIDRMKAVLATLLCVKASQPPAPPPPENFSLFDEVPF